MKKVRTSKELGLAIKNGESYIYIEGDLKNKVLRIKFAGKLAWGIAFTSIAAAVALYLAAPAVTTAGAAVGGPAGAAVGGAISFTGSAVAVPTAITILGVSATKLAIVVGVVSGGTAGIMKLRDKYEIVENNDKILTLKKK